MIGSWQKSPSQTGRASLLISDHVFGSLSTHFPGCRGVLELSHGYLITVCAGLQK